MMKCTFFVFVAMVAFVQTKPASRTVESTVDVEYNRDLEYDYDYQQEYSDDDDDVEYM